MFNFGNISLRIWFEFLCSFLRNRICSVEWKKTELVMHACCRFYHGYSWRCDRIHRSLYDLTALKVHWFRINKVMPLSVNKAKINKVMFCHSSINKIIILNYILTFTVSISRQVRWLHSITAEIWKFQGGISTLYTTNASVPWLYIESMSRRENICS